MGYSTNRPFVKVDVTGEVDKRFGEVTSQLADETKQIESLKYNKMDKNTNDISVSQINKNKGKLDQTYVSEEFIAQFVENTQGFNSVPENFSLTTQKFSDKSVDPRSTTFIESSGNLFNTSTTTAGYNISSSDGSLMKNSNYTTSDYIPIKPETDYTFGGFNAVSFYNGGKQFISRLSLTYTGETVKSLANSFFIRVHYENATSYFRQVNKGSELLPYEIYRHTLKGIKLDEVAINSIEVNETMLVNRSVSPGKTTFIETGTNLYNHNTIEEGVYVANDGSIMSNDGYFVTDYIQVESGSDMTIIGFRNIAYFDVNKEFKRRANSNSEEQTLTMDYDVHWIRLNFQADPYTAGIRVNKGGVLLEYEPYKEVLNGVELSDEAIGKIINKDKQMLDMPINGIFSADETYDAWPGFGNDTTAVKVYQMYDDLVALYPDYITKQTLGNDDWGNPICVYYFTPSKPQASLNTRYPKIFLTGGTHGYEHVSVLTMYLMFKNMCEKWKSYPLLEALRFNVDFVVIPVVNPSGWNDYTRQNRNGVDINRNFPEGWIESDPESGTYGGVEPASQLETQYVMSVFDDNPNIDIMYDFHNFSGAPDNPNWYHFIWVPTGSGEIVQHMAQMLISRMTRKWRDEYTFIPDDYFAGYTDGTAGAMIQDHARERGIKYSATFEVSGRWWLASEAGLPGGIPYDEVHRITAVESLVNWLLINLKELIK